MGASSLPSGSSNVSCNAGSEAAFFYPGDDRLTGYTEGPLKPPQAAALLIGMQDLLPAFFWIRMWCGILSALSAAGTAEIFLLSIGRSTITHQCITPAMRTTNNDSDHGAFHLSYVSWSYAITSFSFLPLPGLQRTASPLPRSGERCLPPGDRPLSYSSVKTPSMRIDSVTFSEYH